MQIMRKTARHLHTLWWRSSCFVGAEIDDGDAHDEDDGDDDDDDRNHIGPVMSDVDGAGNGFHADLNRPASMSFGPSIRFANTILLR